MVEKLKAKLYDYQEKLNFACHYYGAESKEAQHWLNKIVCVLNTLSKITDDVF